MHKYRKRASFATFGQVQAAEYGVDVCRVGTCQVVKREVPSFAAGFAEPDMRLSLVSDVK